MQKSLWLFTLPLLLAACAQPAPQAGAVSADAQTHPAARRYQCNDGKKVAYTYQMKDNRVVAVLNVDNQTIPMHQAEGSDTQNLVADAADNSTGWRIQGNDAILSWRDANGTAVMVSCTLQ